MDNKILSVKLRNTEFKFAEQENTNWCWAASIQNILKYYGIEKPQYQLAANLIGQVENWFTPNHTATIEQISGILNTLFILDFNDKYKVTSICHSKVHDNIIITEIENNRPILYVINKSGSGHALVVIGADYYKEQMNKIIDKLYLFDPWPGRGHKNYSILELKSYTSCYWTLKIEKD